MKSLSKLNMNLNEILEMILENVSEIPSDGKEGELKYYTITHSPIYYNGNEWKDCSGSNPDTTSITNATINNLGHLILTISNDTEYDCGVVRIIAQEISYTLLSSEWTEGLYTISDEAILLDSKIHLKCSPLITDLQYEALAKANIIDTTQSKGSIILKALGTVPTIDIPIKIIID